MTFAVFMIGIGTLINTLMTMHIISVMKDFFSHYDAKNNQ